MPPRTRQQAGHQLRLLLGEQAGDGVLHAAVGEHHLQGATPNVGELAAIRFTGSYNGNVFDDLYKTKEPLYFRVGGETLLPVSALDVCSVLGCVHVRWTGNTRPLLWPWLLESRSVRRRRCCELILDFHLLAGMCRASRRR